MEHTTMHNSDHVANKPTRRGFVPELKNPQKLFECTTFTKYPIIYLLYPLCPHPGGRDHPPLLKTEKETLIQSHNVAQWYRIMRSIK